MVVYLAAVEIRQAIKSMHLIKAFMPTKARPHTFTVDDGLGLRRHVAFGDVVTGNAIVAVCAKNVLQGNASCVETNCCVLTRVRRSLQRKLWLVHLTEVILRLSLEKKIIKKKKERKKTKRKKGEETSSFFQVKKRSVRRRIKRVALP